MTRVQLMKVSLGNISQCLSVNNAQLTFYIDNSQLMDSPTSCDSGSSNKSATTSTTSAATTTTTSSSGSTDCSKSFPAIGR